MKILLAVPEYPPYHIGGGGEVYKNLAENYRKNGHEVVVMYGYYPTKTWGEDVIEHTDINGIKFYQISEIPFPKSKPFLRTVMPPNLKSGLKLKKIIEREKPDAAHLNGYGLIYINIIAFILRWLGIKYIFTIHGYSEKPAQSNIFIRLIWKLYVWIIMNRTLKWAKKVTCVSKYVKEDKRNIYFEKSVVIYNGVNPQVFDKSKTDINIRKRHNISDKTKIIFSLGRITEIKGFQNVIKLLPRFIDRGVDVKYLIAGNDDGYRMILDRLIKQSGLENNVEFIGFIDFETKSQYITQCDIFATPSLWEAFGLVALEGMAQNKIILSSNHGGLSEVLADYENKVLISDSQVVEKIINFKTRSTNPIIFDRFDYNLIAKSYLDILK